jgi:hypothetical protein
VLVPENNSLRYFVRKLADAFKLRDESLRLRQGRDVLFADAKISITAACTWPFGV